MATMMVPAKTPKTKPRAIFMIGVVVRSRTVSTALTMASAPPGALFYVCGPGSLIEAARAAAGEVAIPAGRVQYESFE